MGVGPLIHAPFLLEHSFSECGFRPGGDGPSPPPGLRVGVGYFLRLWVRVVRESAARPNNISLQLARLRERAVENNMIVHARPVSGES